MHDEQENVCCQKRTCVTAYVMFNTTCLDREVLQLARRARCDIRADEPDYSTQSYRKAAYRQYTLWKYGKLGRGNRNILPSCVVTTIKRPSHDKLKFANSCWQTLKSWQTHAFTRQTRVNSKHTPICNMAVFSLNCLFTIQ